MEVGQHSTQSNCAHADSIVMADGELFCLDCGVLYLQGDFDARLPKRIRTQRQSRRTSSSLLDWLMRLVDRRLGPTQQTKGDSRLPAMRGAGIPD